MAAATPSTWLRRLFRAREHTNASHYRVGGEVARYGLEAWWLGSFTDEERQLISDTYRPLGLPHMSLTDGAATYQPELSPFAFLANLATWLNRPPHGHLARKVADFASTRPMPHDPWQTHFAYSNLCKVYYRWRDEDPDALGKAIMACERDIEVSRSLNPEVEEGVVVAHHCYNQLRIILDKMGRFEEAIELCDDAERGGWRGDWEHERQRLRRKIKKVGR